MSVYEQVKQALQDIVAPELKALQIEIRRLDEKIDGKITSLRAEMLTEFKRVDEKIDSLDNRLNEKIDSLDNRLSTRIDSLDEKVDIAINIRERLVAIETELGLRKKESGKRVKAK
jgi:peptidoglycan hydrolase CwlO-like protein